MLKPQLEFLWTLWPWQRSFGGGVIVMDQGRQRWHRDLRNIELSMGAGLWMETGLSYCWGRFESMVAKWLDLWWALVDLWWWLGIGWAWFVLDLVSNGGDGVLCNDCGFFLFFFFFCYGFGCGPWQHLKIHRLNFAIIPKFDTRQNQNGCNNKIEEHKI